MHRKFLNKETGNGSGGGAGSSGGTGEGGAQGGTGGAGGGASGGAASGTNADGAKGAQASGASGGSADNKGGAGGGDSGGGWGDEGEPEKKADDKGGKAEGGKGEGGEAAYKLEALPQELSEFASPESLEAFTKFANDEKIPVELANKLAKYSAMQAKAQVEASREFLRTQSEGWFNEIKADKEIGGDNFEATKTNINRALQHSGQTGLHASLKQMGVNNFPPLVRLLNAYGALLAPDSGQLPGAKGGKGTETLEQMQQRWYVTDAK